MTWLVLYDLFKWTPGPQIQVNDCDSRTWTMLHHASTCRRKSYLHAYQNSPVFSDNSWWLFLSKTPKPLTRSDTALRERRNLAHYEKRNWSSVVARMLSEINSASGGRPPASELLGSCNETNNISCLGRPLSAHPFSVGVNHGTAENRACGWWGASVSSQRCITMLEIQKITKTENSFEQINDLINPTVSLRINEASLVFWCR